MNNVMHKFFSMYLFLFIKLFHQPTIINNFLYSLTICLLHYYPRHVSSINMPIFRRKNCIHTASGIVALCKRLPSTLVEMLCEYNFSSWRLTCWYSKHVEDNNVTNILLTNKENCALKFVDEIILYYDARSKKHQILFITLYMFRARRAHHQKRQIVSIQPLVTVILKICECTRGCIDRICLSWWWARRARKHVESYK